MLIPFSAPHVPELDALAPSERARVLLLYASSQRASRLLWLFKGGLAVALVLFIIAVNLHGFAQALLIACSIAAIFLGIVAYRFGAASELRKLVAGQSHGS